MKVLISAFSCYPARGSEPDVGWSISQAIAREHEVWVLTEAANRAGIEKAMVGSPNPRLHCVYVSLPFPLRLLQKANVLGIPLGYYLYYTAWQIAAFRIARRLHESVRFDLVHHATFVNSWAPTFMGYLGVPFIWSAGVRERTPWRFLQAMSWHGAASETVRNLATAMLGWAMVWLVGRRAAVIFTASVPERWPRDLPVLRLPLGGLGTEELERLAAVPLRGNAHPFRVASVGRLLGLKGVGFGLRAFARLRQEVRDAEYWIIGEGPERSYLEGLAERLGCRGAVTFLGWVPREQLPRYLAEVDVLLHPSLHEQFGYAVVEAMAAGRPVVCLDVAALGLLVREGCGVRVPVREPEQVVADLHAALRQYALDRRHVILHGMNARSYVQREWSWETIGTRVLYTYEQVGGKVNSSWTLDS